MRFFIAGRILTFLFFLTIFQNVYSQTSQQEAEEMLDLVNELRANNGRSLLVLNTELNNAAFNHSDDMARNNYFSHEGLNGSNFSQRARAAGYSGSPRGENIAAGNSAVVATFNQWVNSAGHLRNMLNNDANEMGIGHASFSGSRYTHYWTQILGKGSNVLADEDEIFANTMKIYPNPVKDILHISLNNSSLEFKDVKLMSAAGQIVYQQLSNQTSDNLELNISHLPTGVYFLYFQNTNVHKILKY